MENLVCRNCREPLEATDKYCSRCGNLACAVKYDPDEMLTIRECIYGPPPRKRVYKCGKCGKEYTAFEMIETIKYCSACGGALNKICDEND